VNLVVTNAPGPPVPLYLAGARLLELFPMMPVMGNLTLVVAVLSYDGQINLTAVADRDGCPDLEIFTDGVRTALDDLARSALAPVPCQVGALGHPREPADHRPFGKEGIDAPVQ
jgi:diacylglycerol O-acyltransferase / wax synthase